MSIYGQVDPATGYLQNIRNTFAPGPDDVPLAAMPDGFGPWTYDAANQAAVPVDPKAARQAAARASVAAPVTPAMIALRTLMLLLRNHLNVLHKRLAAQDAAVAGATGLADLKTSWAALAAADPLPQLTLGEMFEAFESLVTTADAG